MRRRAQLVAFGALAMLLSRGRALDAAPDGRDYRLDSPAWNGLSSLGDEAARQGCAMTAADQVDWARLGPRDVLFFVYPQSPIDPVALGDYLMKGGRLLLADDFGSAEPAFAALELRRTTAHLEGVPREPRHPELPVARVTLLTALGRSAPRLIANHPAAFQTRLPATYAFSPGQALVVEGKVGKGRFVALSDPSVLINNMAELPDNQAFARALLAELCVPGADGDRVHLVSGAFQQSAPVRPTASGAGSFDHLNELFGTLNRSVEELATSLAFPLAALLCLAATALAWTALSRQRGSRHADGHFVRADGAFRRSAHVLVESLPRDGRGDHALALVMLRAEVMRQLGTALGPIPAGAPRAVLLRRVGETLGATARASLARFFAIGPAADGALAERPISRAQFARALAFARPILAHPTGPKGPQEIHVPVP